jgi:long-chain acyl-CoA synthetase
MGEDAFSLRETLDGKEILLTGSTGFLGKVILFLVLKNLPRTRVRLLARGKKGMDAGERLEREVLASPVFDPLRELWGEDGFWKTCRERLRALDGDISQPSLGIQNGAEMRTGIDVIVHCAGLTDFNPPLKESLRTNTMGATNMLEFARGLKVPRLVHVSTCYVAGARAGRVPEDEDPVGFYPRKGEVKLPFDAERELEDCLRLVKRVEEEAKEQERDGEFRERILERFRRDHKDPEDAEAYAKALDRERERWIDRTLSEEGKRRAARWGWPNIYTYSKSLAEQVILKRRGDVQLAIARPAILESSLEFPFPGWNEGINTSAPLTYMAWRGHRFYPTKEENVLDVIPVDHVAAGCLHVAAALLRGKAKQIYQLGSSDSNPLKILRLVDLTDLANRDIRKKRTDTPAWEALLLQQLEAVPVSYSQYDTFSAPGVRRLAGTVSKALDALPHGPWDIFRSTVKGTLEKLEKTTERTHKVVEVFLPFLYSYSYRFEAANARALRDALPDDERALFPFEPEKIDWRHYFMKVHIPGLHRWVFPEMDSMFKRSKEKRAPEHEDLLEMFRASTYHHEDRVALRQLRAGTVEKYTYGEVEARAMRAAGFLRAQGVQRGDRVLLVSQNRPEWPMAFFGIMEAGACAVPVDSESMPMVVQNLARVSGAKGVIVSDKVADKLHDTELACPLWTFDKVFAAEPLSPRGPRPPPDEPASLIYTSGTTGVPKGVLLSHKNFSTLLSSLEKVFDLGRTDRLLSVLPLHHTFEFSCGLLLPLARGSSIAYMEDLTAENLSRALREEQITAIIGVPALWQLLERKIRQSAKDRGAGWEKSFDTLVQVNRWLRDKVRLRTGRLMFNPVHRALGGHIRYLISGGAALPPETFKFYRGLGFRLFEGYGLTEAAPVIAVNKPGDKPLPGSAGRPLPGMEVKVHEPDANGIGEIWAKGPNVMLGYDQAPEETAGVLVDGWLRTGDLGRIDDKGRIFITGRVKDVIVDAAGKNVYPDELEEIYGNSPYVKELSVVGVPDGRGSEQVACLAVPDYAANEELERPALQEKVREHFKNVSTGLPYHQRIKVLRLWDGELPRTATRKVKRSLVRAELERMLAVEQMSRPEPGEAGELGWLRKAVAALAGVPDERVRAETRFAEDLAFDSLLVVELALEIERRTGIALTEDDLARISTVGELAHRIGEAPRPKPVTVTAEEIEKVEDDEADDLPAVPGPVKSAVKQVLHAGQMAAYGRLFATEVTGRGNIPLNRSALVIANHSSHLDMGLVKYALKDWAPQLAALAARDYFFGNKARRFFFGNFTNVVPMERAGTPDESMRDAVDRIRRGENLLIFPEGTRSPDGSVQEFKHGVGWLVLRARVDVLPVYTWGTHRALPKGAAVPRARKMGAKIGPLLPFDWIEAQVKGMPRREQYREIARICREAILALKDDQPFGPGAAAKKRDANGDMESLFEELARRYDPRAAGVDRELAYYFSLGGGERWSIKVSGSGCEVIHGKVDPADCVVKTTPDMLRRIVREKYFPSMDEIAGGAFKTSDLGLLSTFQQAFGL